MTIPLIDESHYQAQMDTVVMPALKQCSTEGWMDPAQAPARRAGNGRQTALRVL